ncbi:hypothetical protein UREG_03848 [Uncinocarpus reesii 1704]|uniref:GH18 domain-containing protein n=1 Tax=Uncinocarpus reesii (strain UAMH 1704) TaxID=336963 RepID=C4JLZ0_UNCRE|nr:uncharacterized protein UREG_03848 [Uncinocarpus reesii 1704]EEP79002.1 hypothetical protein UREG_03848 [Uncinocarpus reesii 1704]
MPPTLRSPGHNGAITNPRVICYYQTYYPNNGPDYVSTLPLLRNNCGVSHIILAAIHINAEPGNITLNDHTPDDPRYTPLWAEMRVMQTMEIKVMGMLGGAAKGSYQRLDGGTTDFEAYYGPLRDMIRAHNLDGLDLDVEEEMSLEGIVRLIDRLKSDFGDNFIITLAPVATAMVHGLKHLSGFDYRELEAARGPKISWYNVQFYNGWGHMLHLSVYDTIMLQGWKPEKIVIGLLTNPANGSQGYIPMETMSYVLATVLAKYPFFGGVSGWEYFNGMPGGGARPWEWAASISLIMAMRTILGTTADALGLTSMSSSSLPSGLTVEQRQSLCNGGLLSSSKVSHSIHTLGMLSSQANFIIALSSTTLRLLSYVFLRWIPGHPFTPIILTSLLVYLASIYLAREQEGSQRATGEHNKTRGKKSKGKTQSDNGEKGHKNEGPRQATLETRKTERVSALRSLLLGVPSTTSKLASYATVGINIALALLTLDFVLRGLIFYPTEDLSFSRVGYVSPTSAKIFVREPNENFPVHISYQEVEDGGTGKSMMAGTLYSLEKSTDFTYPISITGLKPSTKYRYSLSNNQVGEFVTAPEPGSPEAESLTFVTSSCIKPNFPYNPLSHPFRIHGVDILTSTLERLSSALRPAFMLFLGDFIYIDVPWRFGSSTKHYRNEYRRVYSSPSWQIPPHSPANIPWIHTLDDHEIANDWASGNETPPYPAAADPYLHYHVSVNPPIPEDRYSIPSNTTYFSFVNGPASFYLLDTRTYRSHPLQEDSTMLGPAQLQSLLDYILRPEPEGVKWKIITSSVPFTKNWHVGTPDTWGGFLKERRKVFEAMWKAEYDLGVRVVLLSGDRHEFAATRFPDPVLSSTSLPETFSGAGRGIHEFCTGPLSQFYLPVRSYRQEDNEDVAIKYVPDGNFKFGLVHIGVDKSGDQPASYLTYSLYVNGKEVWRYRLAAPLAAPKGRVPPPGEIIFDHVDNWEEGLRKNVGSWAAFARERSGWVGKATSKAWDGFLRSIRVDE